MLIAQISDFHIRPDGQMAYEGLETNTMTRRAIATVAALDPAPDCVLVTGDLADCGRPEEYALVADMPAIDLYQLPSAGIRPAGRAVRVRDRERGALVPQQGAAWGTYATVSALLAVVWLTVGVTTGGLAWVPWFLLIIIPWGLAIARRPKP